MKILYIASSGGYGGASVALFNLIEGLYKDNEIHVIFPNRGGFSDQIEKLKINCHYFTFSITVYPRYNTFKQLVKFPYQIIINTIQNYFAYKHLLSIVKKEIPNIIHTNVGPLDIGFRVAKKMRIKHIWHIREYQDIDFDLHFFPSKKNFIKKINDPINHSIAITEGVFKYWDLTPKDKVIYDGVVDDIQHKIIPKKKKYFLFVGRLEEAKGIKNLLNTFIVFAAQESNYCLLIAGTGDKKYIEECKIIVEKSKIENRVCFLGQRNDVYKLMEEAKAIVVPSRFEGFGFITTEAMYNHCLVIGRNTAGTKEQFDNGFSFIGSEIGYRFNTEEELLSIMHDVISLPMTFYNDIVDNANYSVMNSYTKKNIYKM